MELLIVRTFLRNYQDDIDELDLLVKESRMDVNPTSTHIAKLNAIVTKWAAVDAQISNALSGSVTTIEFINNVERVKHHLESGTRHMFNGIVTSLNTLYRINARDINELIAAGLVNPAPAVNAAADTLSGIVTTLRNAYPGGEHKMDMPVNDEQSLERLREKMQDWPVLSPHVRLPWTHAGFVTTPLSDMRDFNAQVVAAGAPFVANDWVQLGRGDYIWNLPAAGAVVNMMTNNTGNTFLVKASMSPIHLVSAGAGVFANNVIEHFAGGVVQGTWTMTGTTIAVNGHIGVEFAVVLAPGDVIRSNNGACGGANGGYMCHIEVGLITPKPLGDFFESYVGLGFTNYLTQYWIKYYDGLFAEIADYEARRLANTAVSYLTMQTLAFGVNNLNTLIAWGILPAGATAGVLLSLYTTEFWFGRRGALVPANLRTAFIDFVNHVENLRRICYLDDNYWEAKY
jgi:hypothetical protein